MLSSKQTSVVDLGHKMSSFLFFILKVFLALIIQRKEQKLWFMFSQNLAYTPWCAKGCGASGEYQGTFCVV